MIANSAWAPRMPKTIAGATILLLLLLILVLERIWCRVRDAVGALKPAAQHAPFIVRLLDSDDDSHGQKGLVFEDRRGWSMTSIGHARF